MRKIIIQNFYAVIFHLSVLSVVFSCSCTVDMPDPSPAIKNLSYDGPYWDSSLETYYIYLDFDATSNNNYYYYAVAIYDDNVVACSESYCQTYQILSIRFDLLSTTALATGAYGFMVVACGNIGDICEYPAPGKFSHRSDLLTIENIEWTLRNDCDFTIEVYNDGMIIDEASCVYINSDPAMPNLTAQISSSNISGWIDWIFEVIYNRSNRNDDTVISISLDANNIWEIYNPFFDTLFYGGECVITAHPEEGNCFAQTFSFSIRGENADSSIIEDFIDQQPGEWYNKYVALHESGVQNGRHYLQFNEVGYPPNCNASDIYGTPNWDGSDPGGFGLYQLTDYRHPDGSWDVPTLHELWSWKANVFSGCNYLYFLQASAYTYTNEQRYMAFDQCGMCMYIPIEILYNVTFEEGTDIIIDHAVALKRYNGASGQGNGEYVQWISTEQIWQFNRTNNLGFNYVERICENVE